MFTKDSYFYFLTMALMVCWSTNFGRCLKWEPPEFDKKGRPIIDDDSTYWACADSNFFYVQLRAIILLSYAILAYRDSSSRKSHLWNVFVNFVCIAGYSSMMTLGHYPTQARVDALVLIHTVTIGFDAASGLLPVFLFGALGSEYSADAKLTKHGHVIAERFGLMIVLCMGELVVSATIDMNDGAYDDWEHPLSAWDNWTGWTSPDSGRVMVVLITYCLKLILFDAAAAEEAYGSSHPMEGGGVRAELWQLSHAPIAFFLVVLGGECHAMNESNTAITGLDARRCRVFNLCLGGILIISGLQLLLYQEGKCQEKVLFKPKRVRVCARLVVGVSIVLFREVWKKKGEGVGSGLQFLGLVAAVMSVVVVDVNLRNWSHVLLKRDALTERVDEENIEREKWIDELEAVLALLQRKGVNWAENI